MTKKRNKVNRNYTHLFVLLLLPLLVLTLKVKGKTHSSSSFSNILTGVKDTVPPVKENTADTIPASTKILPKDSSIKKSRIDTFNIRMSKDSLTDPVNYNAEDSMVMDVRAKKIYLYGKTQVSYTDIKVTAPVIIFDQATQNVTAKMGRDTSGNVSGMAKLVQADQTTVSDSIKFNFKTQKGLTHSTFFQQDEIYNYAKKVKKIDQQTFYAYMGRFTTCNLDTPHFAFRFKKAKFINKKIAVTGPVHPEFEEVPVPIYLPFGIFPLQTGRHSGLLPPQLTVTEDFGLGLEGLGYYKVINDYFDAKIWGDIYSYGSWRLNFAPAYRKRYRYQGALTFSLQNTKFGFKGDPDFSRTKSFFVTWSHSMDSKARPGTSFSASVNAGSSKYLRLIPNGAYGNVGTGSTVTSGYQPINFTNQLSSSITYQKSWQGKPYNLSVSLNHNQNTATSLINLNMPDVAFTVNTLYPFQRKEFAGESKWYEKLGVAYNGNIKGQVSFYDTAFSFRQLIDTFQWGASHNVPITLSLPPLGPLQIAPGISYQERWFAQQFFRRWNNNTKKIDTSINKGFYSAREFSVSLSLSTAIFGTFNSKKKDAGIQSIRHVMRPQIGMNFKPDLMKPYYYRTQVDTLGNQALFSVFDGSIFSPFSSGRSGGMSFGIDNNLEMKVRSKKDTGENAVKKVKILDGFGITGSYNFLADSFKLSTFNLYARSNLFEKINITASATLDPYQTDPSTGYRIDKLAWAAKNFSLGRITSGSLNASTTFQSKQKDEKKKNGNEAENFDNLTQDQMMQQLDYIRRNPAEFADFSIPWSLNVGFSLSFSTFFKRDYSGFETDFSSSINFSGDFNLTPKWKMGANGYYDFRTSQIQSFTMFISRDLHCWQMSINVTPVGIYRFFNISISPKSGLLRDLRINRTRYFYNQ